MEISFEKDFTKDYKRAPKPIQTLAQAIIKKLSAANNLQESGVDFTKIEGQKKSEKYYRIRVGDWRIGVEYVNPSIILVCLLTRGQIYKNFPPGSKK